MDFNTETRRKQLENLQQVIASSKQKIELILGKFGWDADKVLEDSQLITCSLDHGHKIPRSSAEQHVNKCAIRKEGYDLNERFLSEPSDNPTSSILIDDHKKIEVISGFRKTVNNFKSGWNGQDPDPKTADRLTSTFSPHERLALYNYAVASTVGPPMLSNFDTLNARKDDRKPLTYEEQVAQERDAKRRRIKYKAIHTSHKNHSEVLREVIDGQMDQYKEWLNVGSKLPDTQDEIPADVKEENESEGKAEVQYECTSFSRNSTHSGSSRSSRIRYRNEDDYRERYRHKSRSPDRSSREVYRERDRDRRSRDDGHGKKYRDDDRGRHGRRERRSGSRSRSTSSRKRVCKDYRRSSSNRCNGEKRYRT